MSIINCLYRDQKEITGQHPTKDCSKFLCSSVYNGIATSNHEELVFSNSYYAAAIVRSIVILLAAAIREFRFLPEEYMML